MAKVLRLAEGQLQITFDNGNSYHVAEYDTGDVNYFPLEKEDVINPLPIETVKARRDTVGEAIVLISSSEDAWTDEEHTTYNKLVAEYNTLGWVLGQEEVKIYD